MTDTRWNGEPCTARRITAIVADNEFFPGYWARGYVGTRRNIVEVTYGSSTFYLDDEDGSGWHKTTHGGSPRFAHSNISIDPDSIESREGAAEARLTVDTITSDALDALYDERDQLKAWLERGFDEHMAFKLLRPDGTDEDMPCADWCYACRVGNAEAAIARVRYLHRPVGVVAAAEAGIAPDCAACRRAWPCQTYKAVTEPDRTTPDNPTTSSDAADNSPKERTP